MLDLGDKISMSSLKYRYSCKLYIPLLRSKEWEIVLCWSCHKNTTFIRLSDFCPFLLILMKWDDSRFICYNSCSTMLGILVIGRQNAIDTGLFFGDRQTWVQPILTLSLCRGHCLKPPHGATPEGEVGQSER